MGSTPIELAWEDAAEKLREACQHFVHGRPVTVGVAGAVASGKSTLARLISACVISTDDYLPDYDIVHGADRDDPAFAHLGELGEHLDELRAGRAAEIPTWSFKAHKRTGTRTVAPLDIVVCEGIHALHRSVRSRLDIKVFVHAHSRVRWARWEAIELAGDRGWGVDAARKHFDEIAEPVFAARAEEYRSAADFIVQNHG